MQNMTPEQRVRCELFAMRDEAYRAFMCPLIPTVEQNTVIGIRTPTLRRYARALARTPDAQAYLSLLPHLYYEENNLHAFLIEQITDYDACVTALDEFLPYVDNWATCDSLSPHVLGQHLDRLHRKSHEWMASPHLYTARFGIGMRMRYFLDEHFSPSELSEVAAVPTEEYYLHMMVAWYFATALAKQYDATLPYFTSQRLDIKTHNKAIQKAIESHRISDERKHVLRQLKV